MNYQKHYDLLIDRARNRILTIYTEWHHVIPRCLGGQDIIDNIVRLTAEEHFVAHQLLVKLYPGNQRLAFAAVAMSHDAWGKRQGNKLYGWLRRRAVSMPFTEETLAKMRAARLGKHHSAATLAKMRGRVKRTEELAKLRAAHIGRSYTYTDEQRRKFGDSNRGKHRSETEREQLRKSSTGRVHSSESRAKSSEARKAYWAAHPATKWSERPEVLALLSVHRLALLLKYYAGIQVGKHAIPPPSETIVQRYRSGESTTTIAQHYGVSRLVIRRRLQEAGCPVRSLSEAMYIRMGRLTPEEKLSIGEAARVALHSKPFSAEYRKKLSAASVIREQNKRMAKEKQLCLV